MIWGLFWVLLWSFFGAILGFFLGVFWGCLGVNFWVILGVLGLFGTVSGLFQAYLGGISGLFLS